MSLKLFPHPVREIRAIADEIGALVLLDAAHRCGMIAGAVFADPLAEGAHLMATGTYESLGGPAGGLVVTNADALAEALAAEVADWRQGFDRLHVIHHQGDGLPENRAGCVTLSRGPVLSLRHD